jgi:hypothetical protein
VGLRSSARKNSAVSKCRQRKGHGPKTCRRAIEEEEEEDRKELCPLNLLDFKFKVYEIFTCHFKVIYLAVHFLGKIRSFENSAEDRKTNS